MALKAVAAPLGSPVGGSGTANTIPRWTGASTLGDSIIVQNAGATAIAIGDAAGVSYVGLVQVKRAGGAGWLTLDHTGGSYAEVQSYNVPLYLNRQGNNTILNATSGNVGIGTATPSFRLDVVGVASQTAARLQVSNSNTAPALNAEPGLNFKNTTNTNGVYTSITNRDSADNPNTQINFINVNQSGSGAINFVTRDSVGGFAERARIDSSGRLLVGVTGTPVSSEVKVAVGGSGNGGQEWIGATGGGVACVPINGGGGQFYTFTGLIGAEAYTASYKATSTGLDVSTSGYGLKLPATPGNGNANTLDAYVDGGASAGGATFAVTPFGWTTSGGNATPTITIRYTVVGRRVTITGRIESTGGANYASPGGTSCGFNLPTGLAAGSQYDCGTGTILGSSPGLIGYVWAYTDGNIYVSAIASTGSVGWFSVTYHMA